MEVNTLNNGGGSSSTLISKSKRYYYYSITEIDRFIIYRKDNSSKFYGRGDLG